MERERKNTVTEISYILQEEVRLCLFIHYIYLANIQNSHTLINANHMHTPHPHLICEMKRALKKFLGFSFYKFFHCKMYLK